MLEFHSAFSHPYVSASPASNQLAESGSLLALPSSVVAASIDDPRVVDSSSFVPVSFCFLTYNPCTLGHGARQSLEVLAEKYCVGVLCIQEGRDFDSRSRNVGGYFCVSAKSDKGSYGCEIWFAKFMHFAVGPEGEIFLTRMLLLSSRNRAYWLCLSLLLLLLLSLCLLTLLIRLVPSLYIINYTA